MTPEQRTVLAALRDMPRGWNEPRYIAQRTPRFMGMAASGFKPPMGERRVRKLLAECVAEGWAERRRSYYVGHTFRITDMGMRA